MAVYADRVKETTTTTGVGTYDLGGAAVGFRTFVAGVGNGATVTYCVTDGTNWEVGEGVVTDAATDTLTRGSIIASSNANAAVSWGAGTKDVFLTASAARLATLDKANTFTGVITLPTGTAGAPALNFGDADSGVYGGANQLNLTAGGVQTLKAVNNGAANDYITVEAFTGGPELRAEGSSATVSIFAVAKGTGGQVGMQTLNAGTYYDLMYAYPLAAITGTQNYIAIGSGNTGVAPQIGAFGGDTNINLDLVGKGTGSIRLNSTTTTVASGGAISTTSVFTHSGSTAHTISTTGAVTFTGAVVQATKGFASAEYNQGNSATSAAINWANGQSQVMTLNNSPTVTFSNPTSGATYKLRLVQDATGSRTITWPTIKWAGGAAPTLSTAANREDYVTLFYNGTSYYGQASTDFR